jgi:putative membrane protein
MGLGFFGMIIFWVLIIVGIVCLIKLVKRGGKKEEKEETALEILKKRYAKGEINKEEFEARKKDIT